MNAERLLNVARALRESKVPEAFSMERYVHNISDDPWCGTPACALGHYAARTDLQDFLVIKDFGNEEDGHEFFMVYANDFDRNAFYDATAVCEHFDIDPYEADALFGERGCRNAKTPEQAAAFIERFVAERS